MSFVVRVEMPNYMGLVTVQGRYLGLLCLFGSIPSMGILPDCGQVNRLAPVNVLSIPWLKLMTWEIVVVENWGFAPTSNLADICSRGCSVSKLKVCLMWWNGSGLLLDGKEMWPSQEFLLPKNVDFERKKSGGIETGVGKMIDCGKFSSLKKSLCEKCPNMEFFLVRILPHSD